MGEEDSLVGEVSHLGGSEDRQGEEAGNRAGTRVQGAGGTGGRAEAICRRVGSMDWGGMAI